jgi:hypothetical protein
MGHIYQIIVELKAVYREGHDWRQCGLLCSHCIGWCVGATILVSSICLCASTAAFFLNKTPQFLVSSTLSPFTTMCLGPLPFSKSCNYRMARVQL